MSIESLEFWKNLFEIAGVVLLLLTFIAGAGALWFSRKVNDRQAAQLQQFDKDLTDAKTKLSKQQERAAAAETALKGVDAKTEGFRLAIAKANERAGKAQENLALAEQHAAEANAKAEGFRLDIAQANERAVNAQLELARIKTPRSLTRIPELIDALKPFAGTEYVFVSVFQDEESIYLLRSIDDLLEKSGWKRGKSVPGFPGINVYGSERPDFTVPAGFNIGVQVSVQTLQEVSGDAPIQELPPYIQAAGTLNVALSKTLSPPQDNPKLVNQEKGDSKMVRIAIGRKP